MDASTSTESENEWIVHGRRFDLREFVARHPGGAHAIGLGRGRDCTHLVESYHPHSEKVWEVLAKYEVPEARKAREAAAARDGAPAAAWPPRDPFFEDIKAVVRRHFPAGAPAVKATREMFFGLVLFGTGVFWAFFYQGVVHSNALAAFVAGVVFVVVNARVLHEGGHFGLSTRPWVNRAACLAWAIPTLCASTWELQHVLSHHQYTNALPAAASNPQGNQSHSDESDGDADADAGSDREGACANAQEGDGGRVKVPTTLEARDSDTPYDVDTEFFDDLAELGSKVPRWLFPYLVGVIVPFALLKGPLGVGTGYAWELLRHGRVCQQRLRPASRRWDAAATLLAQAAIVGYMSVAHGVARAVLVWLAYQFGNGVIFIIFSQVSHIPVVAERWRPTYHDHQKQGWAAAQVEHSMNFAMGSKFAFYLSFGLNFQIEHHLLPSISHDHLPKIAPDVQRVCERHGVRYWIEPTIGSALGELWRALVRMRDNKVGGGTKRAALTQAAKRKSA
eukprot:g7509.t1